MPEKEKVIAQGQNQTDGDEPAESESTATENTDGGEAGDSDVDESASDSSTDKGAKGADKGLEERLRRAEERNRQYEHSLSLLERFNANGKGKPAVEEDQLPEDLATLDRTLDPLLERRFKKANQGLAHEIASNRDDLDAMRFESMLDRDYSDVDTEERERINGEVDEVRRGFAQQHGRWLSRTDAFYYIEGVKARKAAGEQRRGKQVAGQREERRRVASNDAADSLPGKPPMRKPDGNAKVAAIAERARRGERLTKEERAVWSADLERRGAF